MVVSTESVCVKESVISSEMNTCCEKYKRDIRIVGQAEFLIVQTKHKFCLSQTCLIFVTTAFIYNC
jgi:hypothetical protein